MASPSRSRFELSLFLFLDIIYLTVQYHHIGVASLDICRFVLVVAPNRNRFRDHINVPHIRRSWIDIDTVLV